MPYPVVCWLIFYHVNEMVGCCSARKTDVSKTVLMYRMTSL